MINTMRPAFLTKDVVEKAVSFARSTLTLIEGLNTLEKHYVIVYIDYWSDSLAQAPSQTSIYEDSAEKIPIHSDLRKKAGIMIARLLVGKECPSHLRGAVDINCGGIRQDGFTVAYAGPPSHIGTMLSGIIIEICIGLSEEKALSAK